jgi:hypothetical protein
MHNLHIDSHLSRFEYLFLGTFQIGHSKFGIFLGFGTMGIMGGWQRTMGRLKKYKKKLNKNR